MKATLYSLTTESPSFGPQVDLFLTEEDRTAARLQWFKDNNETETLEILAMAPGEEQDAAFADLRERLGNEDVYDDQDVHEIEIPAPAKLLALARMIDGWGLSGTCDLFICKGDVNQLRTLAAEALAEAQ